VSRITPQGGFLDDDGFEHGFLPPEPPASPPHEFHVGGRVYDVDPAECAAYYTAQGKELPSEVVFALPDGGTETHDWIGYGRRFKQLVEATRKGEPLPPLEQPQSEPPAAPEA
jgi:hypothetical protein